MNDEKISTSDRERLAWEYYYKTCSKIESIGSNLQNLAQSEIPERYRESIFNAADIVWKVWHELMNEYTLAGKDTIDDWADAQRQSPRLYPTTTPPPPAPEK